MQLQSTPAGHSRHNFRMPPAALTRELPKPHRAVRIEPPKKGITMDPKTGFELGWDFARYGVAPAPELRANADFRAGLDCGREHWGHVNASSADMYRRKWLNLRASAWKRGRLFADNVTPDYLQRIDVRYCPVTRIELTRSTGQDSDASADRLNNDLGYAAGNILVMSVRANRAKADLGAHELLKMATDIARAGDDQSPQGLDQYAWARLATLTAMATPFPDPEVVETWPLVAHPPPAVVLRDSGWRVKHCLAYAAVNQLPLKEVGVKLTGKQAARDFAAFAQALIMATAAGLRRHPKLPARQAVAFAAEDAWGTPLVNKTWAALAHHVREQITQPHGDAALDGVGARFFRHMTASDYLTQCGAQSRGYA